MPKWIKKIKLFKIDIFPSKGSSEHKKYSIENPTEIFFVIGTKFLHSKTEYVSEN